MFSGKETDEADSWKNFFDMCQDVMHHVVSNSVEDICLKHIINKLNGETYRGDLNSHYNNWYPN